ncbi:MarR family transcriptional regulator [Pedobacter petrophilus]|uniref:MarR family transcriptional regulator n=1 Tax=Pedobacter petrophilus TaxID=1908241 RepID=A0A7K0FW94_9SPHI|nr:helix-turn-helix domain-containing protein [Pedobacter petrophilus]MRX75691.1 MarR family transcriptional regulator [Pedobacter petrophilus]
MEKNIDEKLREIEQMQDRNWQKLSFNLRKHLDLWSHANMDANWKDMKLSYWPIICNIGINGCTPSELSRKSMIPKQNISRTIKELEALGMIESKSSEVDKRSEVLFLSQKGKELTYKANNNVMEMNNIYRKVVGAAELEITITALNKILVYHEDLQKNS